MKCKNKEVIVNGMFYDNESGELDFKKIHCIITNDQFGKTLSVDDGKIQLTIPFEQIEKWLR